MKQVSYERPRPQSRRKKESAEIAFDRQPLNGAVWAVMSLAGNGATGSAGRKRKNCEDIGAEGERLRMSSTSSSTKQKYSTIFEKMFDCSTKVRLGETQSSCRANFDND